MFYYPGRAGRGGRSFFESGLFPAATADPISRCLSWFMRFSSLIIIIYDIFLTGKQESEEREEILKKNQDTNNMMTSISRGRIASCAGAVHKRK